MNMIMTKKKDGWELNRWPHRVDHENKEVFVYVESGWPTTMAVPQVVYRAYPGYTAILTKNDPNK